jgi:hypothetical protein
MSANQPEPIQFEFDFGDGKIRECVCCAYPRSFDARVVAFAMARAAALEGARNAHHTAPVFSIADKIARKQQARDDMLYQSILERIKHLPF